jgi:hypothetical protein
MARMQAVILSSVNNGPFVYQFAVDGATQNAAINVATAAAALDAIKAIFTAQGGTLRRIVINAETI